MPVVYRCKHCGFILHVHARVGQDSYGLREPKELMSIYGGHCPHCGRRLEPPTLDDIIVKPDGPEELLATLEESVNGSQWIGMFEQNGVMMWLRRLVERRAAGRALAGGIPGRMGGHVPLHQRVD